MGRANVLCDESYLCAWGASMENVPIAEDFVNGDLHYNQFMVDHENIYIPIDYETPEMIAIKHDLFEKLSDEAKEVFSIIISAPSEVITPITGSISRSKLMRYCKNKLGELKTNSVFNELKDYLTEIMGN
jgi:hypothetical protein